MQKISKLLLFNNIRKFSLVTILLLFLLIVFSSCELFISNNFASTIEVENIVSSIDGLEETYLLYIIAPPTVDKMDFFNSESADRWPVLYVLDGDIRTKQAAKTVRDLNLDIAIVGIGYEGDNRRRRDYTPSTSQEEGFVDAGGADLFFDFIQQDLISYIEQHYAVSSAQEDRILFGHSLGGLASIYSALTYPNLFGGVIAASPSLMWDSQFVFKKEKEKNPTITDISPFIRIYSGGFEFPGMSAASQLFAKQLSENWDSVDIDSSVFPAYAHESVVSFSLHAGLSAWKNMKTEEI